MAKTLCDLCQQNYATALRFGVNLCPHCEEGYDKAMLGVAAYRAKYADPECFPNATPIARKNIIEFFIRKNQQSPVNAQQIQAQHIIDQKEKTREAYAKSIGVTYKTPTSNSPASEDSLYKDIGQKIKNWAKWIFILEAIAAIMGSFVIMFTAENSFAVFLGLISLFLGPVLAWVSSWILYAYGEMVDKLCGIDKNTLFILNNTQNMLKIMLENNVKNNVQK